MSGIAGGAGEFGHISIDPGGDLCRCGNRGCLELYASFARPLEQISRIVRRPVTMDDVIMMAEQGDVRALRMIEGHRRVRRPWARLDRFGAQSAAHYHRRPHGLGGRHSPHATDRVI
ncbi:ROK family protein [Mesorhizobium sp. M0563]|uniref:ROK family protein n=1 Tax=unclassified Mesorhizobium TaxID=325217 RepID=UPI00333A074C